MKYLPSLALCIFILNAIQVQTQPINDSICNAIELSPDSTCQSGTTLNANTNYWHFDCNLNSGPPVWYRTELTGDNNALKIQAFHQGQSNEINIALVRFPFGCDSTYMVIPGSDVCDEYPISYQVNGLDTGTTYYIAIASNIAHYTDFKLCIDQLSLPDGCGQNNTCETAEDLSTIATDSTFICTSGCNVGGNSPEQFFSGCSEFSDMSLSWFTFSTDSEGNRVNINVSSDEIKGDLLIAMTHNYCEDTYGYLECMTGSNGHVNLYDFTLLPSSEYNILIGTRPEHAGQFDLCINTMGVTSECLIKDELTVTETSLGSPLNGPYQPGEKVTFEYTIDSFFGGACQWLRGIVPVFGNGWDPSSFDSVGRPVQTSGVSTIYQGEWDWYPEETLRFNYGLPENVLYRDPVYNDRLSICDPDYEQCHSNIPVPEEVPAAWLAKSHPEGSPCPDTDKIYDARGDGEGCGIMGGWSVTFTLTVRDTFGPQGCAPNRWTNCDVSMYTFTDNEIGCLYLEDVFCTSDPPERWTATNTCCTFPEAAFEEVSRDSSSVRFANTSQNADSIQWIIGTDQTTTSDSIELSWMKDSTVQITLVAYNDCTTDSLSQSIALSNAFPTAGLEIQHSKVCTDTEVQFYNASSSNVTSWQWYFEGGSPEYSQDPNPVVEYDEQGVYDVQLIVSNAIGSDTINRDNFIDANTKPYPVFFEELDSTTLTLTMLPLNAGDSIEFEVEGVGVKHDSVSVFELPGEGVYKVQLTVYNGHCKGTSFVHTVTVDLTSTLNPETNQSVRCYPNPTRNVLHLDFGPSVKHPTHWKLVDISGSTLKTGLFKNPSEKNTYTLTIGDIHPGMYLLRVQIPDQGVLKKRIILMD